VEFFMAWRSFAFWGQWQLLWPHLFSGIAFLLGLWAVGHVLLYKRDCRAAISWVLFIWLIPILGPVLYAILGVNRICRPGRSLRQGLSVPTGPPAPLPDGLADVLGSEGSSLRTLAQLVGGLTPHPLVAGNRIVPFADPDAAIAAMLEAIRQARCSLTLNTYIFDNDPVGRLFVKELELAQRRGVKARVLVDGLGARYSWPSIVRPLRQRGIPVALFLPRWMALSLRYANLRSHRKILVADGRIAFTGGMNIRAGRGRAPSSSPSLVDLHFQVEGPVVAQLQEIFAQDWEFCTGERLLGKDWFAALEPAGPVLARVIPDGPDEDFEKLRLTLLGALACAQRSVCVVTPYFLPDPALITSLGIAARRGVEVDILLPARGNLRLVQWASTALLWQVLVHGCRVWLSPPPFDHSKLVLVDRAWSLLGSANWDARSLRLNFELNLECYDRTLAQTLEGMVGQKLRQARRLTLADVDGRRLPVKLRDGMARLLSPYL
jgi:cardiolipin synthase